MTHHRGRQEAKIGKNKAEKGTEMPLGLGQSECMNNFVDYVMNGSTFNSTRVTLVHTSACWCLLCIHFCLRVSTLRMTLVHTFGPFPSPGAAMVQHWVQQPSIRSKDFPACSNLTQFFWRGDDESQMLMPGALMSIRVKMFPKNE